MRIDSHQHFWNYDPSQYPWITEEAKVLRRDFLPGHLQQESEKVRIYGSIAVQARQTSEESRWLLRLADQHSSILGVVGWIDLRSPRVEEELAEFAQHPKFVGVRHVVQEEPDNDFMLQPAFLDGIGKLKQFGLIYDLLVFPRQLPAAIEIASKFPEQVFVLDHIAKPPIAEGDVSPWDRQIRELAKCPNVFCKVSGMVTEAKRVGWQLEDFRPYLDVVFEAFAEDRLMFGSDWPVCLLAGSYERVYSLAHDYVVKNVPRAEPKIFGENAARAYRLEKKI